MQETVLLYNIDKTDAGKAIISILEKLNVEVIIVKSSDLIFKEANIPFIPLKAIVTQTNVNWTFMQLLKNVKTEYMELTGMNKDMIN